MVLLLLFLDKCAIMRKLYILIMGVVISGSIRTLNRFLKKPRERGCDGLIKPKNAAEAHGCHPRRVVRGARENRVPDGGAAG